MLKEGLLNLIRDKLDKVVLPKADRQDDIDIQNLMGHVTPDLQNVFAYPQVGEVDAPKTGVDYTSESLKRLLAKRGNSIEKIADKILGRAGVPDLKADRYLYAQYKASVLTSLNKLRESDKTR